MRNLVTLSGILVTLAARIKLACLLLIALAALPLHALACWRVRR